MGIGLSICRLISEELGGTVVLDTEYHDGARFVFTLPRAR
jgi:signal transduction histidine kinase